MRYLSSVLMASMMLSMGSSPSHGHLLSGVQDTAVMLGRSALGLQDSYKFGSRGSSVGDHQRRQDTTTTTTDDTPDDVMVPLTYNITVDIINDPTSVDYNTPLPADAISAILSVSNTSVSNVDNGIVVDDQGNTVTDGSADSPTDTDTYVAIIDTSGKYQLYAADDGNFYVIAPGTSGGGTTFATEQGGIATQDYQGRTMFYCPNIMQKYNVSRLRINDEDHLPVGSQMIQFVPLDIGDNAGVYIASDTSQNNYNLITCTYKDSSLNTRIFLAGGDASQAIAQLEDSTMQSIVTGGAVNECALMPFVTPGTAGF